MEKHFYRLTFSFLLEKYFRFDKFCLCWGESIRVQESGCKHVSLGWLEDSIKLGKLQPEKYYHVNFSQIFNSWKLYSNPKKLVLRNFCYYYILVSEHPCIFNTSRESYKHNAHTSFFAPIYKCMFTKFDININCDIIFRFGRFFINTIHYLFIVLVTLCVIRSQCKCRGTLKGWSQWRL